MSLAVTNPDAVPLHAHLAPPVGQRAATGAARRAVRVTAVTGATAGAPAVRCTAVPLDLAPALAPGARGTVELDVDIRAPDDVRPLRRGRPPARPVLQRAAGARPSRGRPLAPGPLLPARRGVDVPGRGLPGAARPRPRAWTWRRPACAQAGGFRRLSRGPRLLVGRGDAPAPAAGAGRGRGRHGLGAAAAPARAAADRRAAAGRSARRCATRSDGSGRACRSSSGASAPYGWPDLQVVLTDAAGHGAHRADHDAAGRPDVITPRAGARVVVRADRRRPGAAPWLDEGFATYAEWRVRRVGVRRAGAPGASGGS